MASARPAKSPGAGGTPGHVRKASTPSSPAPARLSLHSVTPADQEGALASPTAVKSGRSSPSAVQEGGEAMHVPGGANTPPHVHVRNSIAAGDAAATPKVSRRGRLSSHHVGTGKDVEAHSTASGPLTHIDEMKES